MLRPVTSLYFPFTCTTCRVLQLQSNTNSYPKHNYTTTATKAPFPLRTRNSTSKNFDSSRKFYDFSRAKDFLYEPLDKSGECEMCARCT